MTARKAWWGGAWVELGGGAGDLADQYIGNPLSEFVDTTTTSTRGAITATANATPFADGTYTEMDPSLSADVAGVYVIVTTNVNANGVNYSTVLELATGAAAAETPWATVAVGYSNVATAASRQYFVPGFIAAGTRVSVRARSAVTALAVTAVYSFLPATKTFDPGAPVTMGGANIATTARGVTLTAPGSLHTKGAWTEIVASTSATFGNLLVGPQGAAGISMVAGTGNLVDIGIGAASSETVLISDIYLFASNNEFYVPRSPLTYGVNIPSGSRLSARYQRSSTNNAVDLILVGA